MLLIVWSRAFFSLSTGEWPGEFTPTTKPGALEFWVNA